MFVQHRPAWNAGSQGAFTSSNSRSPHRNQRRRRARVPGGGSASSPSHQTEQYPSGSSGRERAAVSRQPYPESPFTSAVSANSYSAGDGSETPSSNNLSMKMHAAATPSGDDTAGTPVRAVPWSGAKEALLRYAGVLMRPLATWLLFTHCPAGFMQGKALGVHRQEHWRSRLSAISGRTSHCPRG